MKKQNWLLTFFQTWSYVSFIVLVLMAAHKSDYPVILNRYSLLVFGALTLIAAVVGISFALYRYLRNRPTAIERIEQSLSNWQSRRWFRPIIVGITSLSVAAVWLYLLGNHVAAYGLLRAYVCFTLILVCLALCYGGSTSVGKTKWVYLPAFGLVILAVAAIVTLEFYPSLYRTDEAFFFSMGRNAHETGFTQPVIYRFPLPSQNYGVGGLWTHALGAWIGLFGFGVTVGRSFFLLLYGLSLPFLWMATVRLYGKATAWAAVIIAAFSYISLNEIRYDAVSSLFLSMAFFFYALTIHGERKWAHFLVGLCAAMCIDGPPIGYVFGLGFGLYYGFQYLAQIRKQHQWLWLPFWLLVAGGFLGLVVFVFLRRNATLPGGEGTLGFAAAYIGDAIQRLRQGYFIEMARSFIDILFTSQPILAFAMCGGIVVMLRRRTSTDKLLLCLFVVWFGIIIFTYPYLRPYYLVHGVPILAIFAATTFIELIPQLIGLAQARDNRDSYVRLAFFLLCIWITVAVFRDIRDARQDSRNDIIQTGEQIAQVLPEDSVVVAAEPYYFGMPKARNFVGGAVEGMMVNFRKMSPEQAWEIVAPDAIVFSRNWPEPAHSPALDQYMNSHQFKRVACWETLSYGQIDLWSSKDQLPAINADAPCKKV